MAGTCRYSSLESKRFSVVCLSEKGPVNVQTYFSDLRRAVFLTAVAPAALAAGETHVMLTTSAGNIELALDSQKAPVSSQNFVDYVNSGYYNNTIFHRVIPVLWCRRRFHR